MALVVFPHHRPLRGDYSLIHRQSRGGIREENDRILDAFRNLRGSHLYREFFLYTETLSHLMYLIKPYSTLVRKFADESKSHLHEIIILH